MANSVFSFSQLKFEGSYDSSSLEDREGQPKTREEILFSMGDIGHALYSDCTNTSCNDDVLPTKVRQQQVLMQPKPNQLSFEDYFGLCFPAPAQRIQETKKIETVGKDDLQQSPFSSSLELLCNYANGLKKSGASRSEDKSGKRKSDQGNKKLSTEEVMRIAGARYIQLSNQQFLDDFSMTMHPFGYALSGLSDDETKDVELAHLLLAAAEKVGYQQYDRASRLLMRCEWMTSERSNPVQRVVNCFAEALRERIDKGRGKYTMKDLETGEKSEEGYSSMRLAVLTLHQNVPFSQTMHITAVQTVLENIGTARKLHWIDFEIRSGIQLTALMQALVAREQVRPFEHLKVTAVGITGLHNLGETGDRLESFAKSLKIRFTFNMVYVSSMHEVKGELFKLTSDDSVVVNCNVILRSLLCRPSSLENMMRMIKGFHPALVLVSELEVNLNSPVFVNRFIEALFYYSNFFDCFKTYLEHNNEHRNIVEATFSLAMHNIVAKEGPARVTRSVKIDVWRAFFSKFGMIEIELSETALYQASLVPKRFRNGDLCTLDKNGKSLIVGWKGTHLYSLSAWKFSRGRIYRSAGKSSLRF